MSTTVSVHAVYGVHLPDDDHARLYAAVQAWIDDNNRRYEAGVMELGEADAWGDMSPADHVHQALIACPAVRAVLNELRTKHGLPPAAEAYYTGEADVRPGRCDIAAGRYVLGWGMLGFPASAVVPVPCRKACDWHTWAECH